MAGSDKTVKVTLVAVAQPYAKGMSEASAATRKLGTDIDSVGTKARGLEGGMGKATGAVKGLAVAGAAVAGTALVAFLGDAVKAAGDLEQSVGGVDAVFKGSADTIHEFGKTAAESVGLSRNEFNELITVTGAMLKNKGLEDFSQKSLDLIKIGADLSATYGGTAKEAVEALNAAMRGESDPIERYGISLNETAVNAELAAKGMNKLTGQALEQAKAQARIDIITRQSADALGKFASEADTLQGQQQRLNAQWEDAKAELGQALLPALTSVVEAMRGGVDAALAIAHAFEAIPGPVKAAVGAIVALHLLRGPLGGFLSGAVEGIKNLTGSLKSVGGVAGGAKAALGGVFDLLGGPWGIAIGAATMALTHWWQEAAKSDQIAGQLKTTLDEVTGAFTDQSKKTIVDTLLGDLSADDIRLLQSLGVNFGDLADAILKGGGDLDAYRGHLVDLMNDAYRSQGVFSDQGQALEGLVNSTNRAADGADKTRAAQEALAGATDKTTSAVAGAVDETTNLDQKFMDVARSMDFAAKKQQAQADAATAAKEANKDLAGALLDVKAAAGDADAAGIAYKQTLDDAQERIRKRIELEKELANVGKGGAKGSSAGVDKATLAHTQAQEKLQRLQASGKATAEQLAAAQDKVESTSLRLSEAQKKAGASSSAAARSNSEEQKRLREELAKYTATLDTNTQAGRDNMSALLSLKDDALRSAEANLKQGDSVDSVKQKIVDQRAEFIKTAKQYGATGKEAEALADKYGLTKDSVDQLKASIDKIPKETVADIKVETGAAETAAKAINLLLNEAAKPRTAYIKVAQVGSVDAGDFIGGGAGTRTPVKRAGGGAVYGPGTATSDSIPAWLSNGEYVIKAAAVARYGKSFFDSVNTMRFAQGGYVSRMQPAAPAVDLDRLAGLVRDRVTVNVQSTDPYRAARQVAAEMEWRAVNGS